MWVRLRQRRRRTEVRVKVWPVDVQQWHTGVNGIVFRTSLYATIRRPLCDRFITGTSQKPAQWAHRRPVDLHGTREIRFDSCSWFHNSVRLGADRAHLCTLNMNNADKSNANRSRFSVPKVFKNVHYMIIIFCLNYDSPISLFLKGQTFIL